MPKAKVTVYGRAWSAERSKHHSEVMCKVWADKPRELPKTHKKRIAAGMQAHMDSLTSEEKRILYKGRQPLPPIENLKSLLHLNQADIANACGVSIPTIKKNLKRIYGTTRIVKIRQQLGIKKQKDKIV